MGMKVLIACEFSGTVRDAFIKRGHRATSCDLLDTETPGPHLKCDVRSVDFLQYDLVIAHPPCTHLAVSGARWFKDKKTEQNWSQVFIRSPYGPCLVSPSSAWTFVFTQLL